jgi:uncharacterized protein (TIGR03067 family)
MRTWLAAIVIIASAALAHAVAEDRTGDRKGDVTRSATTTVMDDADKDLTGDLKGLQGSWTAMVGPNKDVALLLTFKGKDLTFHVTTADGQEFDLKAKAKIDEKANPKKLDFVEMTGPDNSDLPDSMAIYELKGEELKVCGAGPGKDRPTEFKEDADNMVQLTVFKKKKD